MARSEKDINEFIVNFGNYQDIVDNFSQIEEDSLIMTEDKVVPVPQTTDSGKVVGVDENGEFELQEKTTITITEWT